MSGVPPRPLPGHLFPLPVQWYAQDHPRVYGAVLGAALGSVLLLPLVFALANERFGIPVPVLAAIGLLLTGAVTALGVWSAERDVRGATVDGDRERFREAQRLVREGRPGGDAETDRMAGRYARLVTASPLGHPVQAAALAGLLAIAILTAALHIADGRYPLAVPYAITAAAAALYLTVGMPLIEHRKKRARSLLALIDPAPPEEGP
ncbi:hypothetical protein ABZ249_16660 [Nocardiopsis sp. NPDC006139]|uniref:hypothetical protein n=1 Tax=Nocardiopsis sp. NPDC006139 TaxID=3154578 RepID=UPI0033A67815